MKKYLLYLLLVAVSPAALLAKGGLTSLEIQASLESRLTPIVQKFDSQGLVLVKLAFKTKAQSLPGTPFIINDFSVADNEGNARVEKIEMTVLTQKGELPKSVDALLKEACAAYGPAPTIIVRNLPRELIKKEIPPPGAKEAAPVKEKEATPKEITIKDATTPKEPAPIKIDFPEMTDYLPSLSNLMFVGLGLIVAIFFLVIGLFMSAGQVRKAIEKVAGEVQSGAQMGVMADFSSSDKDKGAKSGKDAVTAHISPGDEKLGSQVFNDLPDEGILALLCDCYWGEFDGYAAYVWKRLPVARRQKMLELNPTLRDYSTFVVDAVEMGLGMEQEPYYLAPLPINHLNNMALAKLVRGNATLWAKLPSLRRQAVKLSAREQLNFAQTSPTAKAKPIPQFETVAASASRSLKKKVAIIFHSVQEEEELLTGSEFAPEVMQYIPSLGFFAKLTDEDVRELLQNFSATDLASAWIGPQAVLERMEKLLPQNKLGLLKSYQARVAASRSAPTFVALHQRAIQKIIEKGNQIEAAPEQKAA